MNYEFITHNIEWIFGGVGMPLTGVTIYAIKKKFFPAKLTLPIKAGIAELKTTTHILFIDDKPFKVPEILQKAGWVNTKRIRDVTSLDDPMVISANIFFVDIHGVGKILGFSDEGLGLALALKDKYPNKKLVIYSSETEGDRFHKALKKADSSLRKNADPYEFQQLVEELALQL
jgi:hypothetical protein